MEDFKQSLTENSYTRQEELVFWDCDRELPLMSKADVADAILDEILKRKNS